MMKVSGTNSEFILGYFGITELGTIYNDDSFKGSISANS